MRCMQALLHPISALHGLLQVILHLAELGAEAIALILDDLKRYRCLQKLPLDV